ncbi:oxygenase MpaB family protein [Phenylobacterium immobile]|uniref:oxygenase MpaB family protein n=1 Tax=Phenylobacterium immobile TaxID=21 RepID=UPI000B1EB347|nr:oxygenase MpaB family protein [Phenylobacterium immobile]
MPLRNAIARQIRGLVGSTSESAESPLDHGDAGLFGPDSVCWRVHGDFTTMMIGGVAALLMQMLNRRALAGVWAHSTFRQDMGGRLKRTARFIAITTYGSTEQAQAAITEVRTIHERVRGVTESGETYAASDPELLTWIHVCETRHFLAAWIRYREPWMSVADQDRYFWEVAEIARGLGAEDVPVTRDEVERYLARCRPGLKADALTREAAQAILEPPKMDARFAPFAQLFFQASKDLLPAWARAMHGFTGPRTPGTMLGVASVGGVLRWALQNGAEARARRRVAPQPV